MKSLADAVEEGRLQVRRDRYKYEMRRLSITFGTVMSAIAVDMAKGMAEAVRGTAAAFNALAEALDPESRD